jgi:cell division protein FtsW
MDSNSRRRLHVSAVEFAKVAFIIYVSWALARVKDASKLGVVGIFQTLWPAMLLILVIAVEPDLGCALVLFAAAITLLVVAGTRIRYLFYIGAPLLALAVFAMSRMEKFNHIWKRLEIGAGNLNSMVNKIDPVGAGDGAYQIKESIISFGSGGLDGMGWAWGRINFISCRRFTATSLLATIGQETGFYGFCFVMLVYLVFLYKRFFRGVKSSDNFASIWRSEFP